MTRIGVNILLVGFLIVGLGGLAYLLPFFMPLDIGGIQVFETVVLVCWGLGALLVVVGGLVAGLGTLKPRT